MPRASLTRGYAQVPNSFIENMAAMTPAETSLALILFRRGGNQFAEGERPVEVSDAVWFKWTGLSTRQKDYAAAGLRQKCFRTDGKGDSTRYYFDPKSWKEYVNTRSQFHAECETRTHGRTKVKAVTSNAGMQVHPECKAGGCKSLCDAAGSDACETKTARKSEAVVPVSKPMAAKSAQSNPSTSPIVSPLVLMYAQTLAVLVSIFPTIGEVFLSKLVAAARAVFAGVTDQELASAVQVAWARKKHMQTSEGMFLATVPEVLKARRKSPHVVPDPVSAVAVKDPLSMIAERLKNAAGSIHTTDAKLTRWIVFELNDTAERIEPMLKGKTPDDGRIADELEKLSNRIRDRYMESELYHKGILAQVNLEMNESSSASAYKRNPELAAEVRGRRLSQSIIELLGLPPLTLTGS